MNFAFEWKFSLDFSFACVHYGLIPPVEDVTAIVLVLLLG